MNVSKSPNRFTFQRDNYLKHCEEQGVEPNPELVAMYEKWKTDAEEKFIDPENRTDNLEYDLLTTDWILDKVRSSESYAQNLYAAMCNNEFVKNEVWPLLSDDRWSLSWRSAGGVIADMRQEGDYIDWYCSGMGPLDKNGTDNESYVSEGIVTSEIRQDLLKLGWVIISKDRF